MTELQVQALTGGLVRYFRDVAMPRMQGLPIVNPALQVEAVGFERIPDGVLGVLITPWFMNLVLLPDEGDDWHRLPVGSERSQVFASGRYNFRMAGDDNAGRYQVCSLLSPVLEIPDQQTARAIARAALDALHDRQHHDSESSTHAAEVERRWRGEPDEPVVTATGTPGQPADEVRMSRRAFLGGARHRQSEQAE
ncbi:MAG: [NiFe]-hydrogenase assembly chaperone HybE [Gammaproteobacteria bacterium]|nr:[NiFe]-hydrogenase assembly chaperone HybE [Gammaproteobacteria bacterium]